MSQGERDSGVPEGLEEPTESGFSSDGRRVGGAPCERSERRAGEEFSGEKTRPGVNRSTLTLKGLKGLTKLVGQSIPELVLHTMVLSTGHEEEIKVFVVDGDGVEVGSFFIEGSHLVSPLYVDGEVYVDRVFRREHQEQDFQGGREQTLELISLSTPRAMSFGELWARGMVRLLKEHEGRDLFVGFRDQAVGTSMALMLPLPRVLKAVVEQCRQANEGVGHRYYSSVGGRSEEAWLLEEMPGEKGNRFPVEWRLSREVGLEDVIRVLKISDRVDGYLKALGGAQVRGSVATATMVAKDLAWHWVYDEGSMALVASEPTRLGQFIMEAKRLGEQARMEPDDDKKLSEVRGGPE